MADKVHGAHNGGKGDSCIRVLLGQEMAEVIFSTVYVFTMFYKPLRVTMARPRSVIAVFEDRAWSTREKPRKKVEVESF